MVIMARSKSRWETIMSSRGARFVVGSKIITKTTTARIVKSWPMVRFYFCTIIILFTVVLHSGFIQLSNNIIILPTTADHNSKHVDNNGKDQQFAKESLLIKPPLPLVDQRGDDLHQQPTAFVSKQSSQSKTHKSHHLLNVPFYVYEEFLNWLDAGKVGNMTVQYYVQNVLPVKHTDDYWFAKAAMIHPQRTMDPSKAKLFIVPILLNVIVSQIADQGEPLCVQPFGCNLELLRHVDEYLAASFWFQQHSGRDHLIVASQSGSEWYIPRTYNIRQCNILGWGNRNYGFDDDHNRVLLPKLYVGQACSHVYPKQTDFVMIASMKSLRAFQSRFDVCNWMKLRNNNNNNTGFTTMATCGQGPQCPALAQARLGFHVRGDTYGSNRLIDTLLSGTVPIFTLEQQYEMLPDWINWKILSYYANVSVNQTTFLADINKIVADINKQDGYDEKHKHVVLNRDLFDWKTTIPFDTYMYMLSVHLWPELELERRQTVNVTSPYTALILPRFGGNKQDAEYLPFRAFDFQYKTVSCGELNPDAHSCGECQYINGKEDKSRYSRKEYWRLSLMDYYWKPPPLNLAGYFWWESDPRACGKSCKWTGNKCIHKSQDCLPNDKEAGGTGRRRTNNKDYSHSNNPGSMYCMV